MVRERHAYIGKHSGKVTANQAIRVLGIAYGHAEREFRDTEAPLKPFPKITHFPHGGL